MPLPFIAHNPDRWLHLRLVIGVGITQIIGFGTIFYAFGSVVPALSADLGISPGTAFAAFSLALLVGALAAPTAGRLVDQHGARMVMSAGSLAGPKPHQPRPRPHRGRGDGDAGSL